MPGQSSGTHPSEPWRVGYEAAIEDVLALLDEFDIRRSSLTAPLLLGFRADVVDLKSQRSSRAA